MSFATRILTLIVVLLTLSTPSVLPYVIQKTAQVPLTQVAADANKGLDLVVASMRELVSGLDNSSLTSVGLTQAYLTSIERDNVNGLGLRAIIQAAPEASAVSIAAQLDEERWDGCTRGPLHGIPIIVADNLDTEPILGMATTGGSFAFANSEVPKDAFVVDRLRTAGAIIIGKANMNEMAGWKGDIQGFAPRDGKGITNGWSAVGGQGSSAYVDGGFDAGGNPLGSSSGSAVGVSAGFAAAAIGTDLAGSLLRPAGRAALYSIRPTMGLVSRSGMIPISRSHDVIGPMGKSVWDVAALLEVMVGRDASDRSTHHIPRNIQRDYLRAAESKPKLKDYRFGLPRRFFASAPVGYLQTPASCEQDNRHALWSTVDHMLRLGSSITNADMPISPDDVERFQRNFKRKINNEFRDDLEMYLTGQHNHTIAGVRFNEDHADVEMPEGECCQERNLDSLAAPGRESIQHAMEAARHRIFGATRGLEHLFYIHDVDALMFAVELGQPTVWPGAEGYPAGTVPLGYCNSTGNPFGLMFVVRKWEDAKLIEIMSAYEEAFPQRRAPERLIDRRVA